MTDLIHTTESFVRATLDGEGTGHDYWHCVRVRNTALVIAKEEGADEFVVELASLLHDIADHKFHGGDTEIGPRLAREFLEGQGVEGDVVEHVVHIISHMSWSKSKEGNSVFDSLEMRIVQDADRLEALGAIGIARAFAYGGYKGLCIYDPEHEFSEEYKGDDTPSVAHHFYEKLFKIAGSMYTASAKKLAQEREAYMKEYLDTFLREWRGERELGA